MISLLYLHKQKFADDYVFGADGEAFDVVPRGQRPVVFILKIKAFEKGAFERRLGVNGLRGVILYRCFVGQADVQIERFVFRIAITV